MTTTQWVPKVGEECVYVPCYSGKPEITSIDRITPAGKVGIIKDNGKTLFKRYSDTNFRAQGPGYKQTVYLCPIDQLAELEANYADADSERDQRLIEQKRRQLEREQQHAQELAEVKSAMLSGGKAECKESGDFHRGIPGPLRLPDGSRMYTIHIPVKPEYAERKKGYEVCVVRCWDGNGEWLMKDSRLIGAAYTYANGNTCSFSSCSTYFSKTDEDAVWEAVRSCYCNGW
jgi:hypothetical protein